MARKKRQGASQREYAKIAGISLQMVQKDIAYGRVVFYDDGSINVEESLKLRQQNIDERKRRDRARAQAGNELSGAGGDAVGIGQLRKAELALRVRQAELDYRQRRGELVEKRRVVDAVYEAFRRERDAWLAWVSRAAPELAAEIGCPEHAVQTALDRAVRRHLEELADLKLEL